MKSVHDEQNILFNSDHLRQLIINLHTLTGIWANVLDRNGRDILLRNAESGFCQSIHSVEEGRNRCAACDMDAVRRYGESGQRGLYAYRCHAGLREYLLPIGGSDAPIAYLIFGELLDDSPRDLQWEQISAALDWYEGDLEELHRHFLQLRRCSAREIDAFAEILQVLAAYIRMEELIRPMASSDGQRLEQYLDRHYMEELSLKRISADLHMGTTKLCSLARTLDGGSITRMIARRRVEAAQKLLISSSCPIADVAEKVGYSDYNYFTRIFKAATGMTPRAYRKSVTQ